MTLTNVAMLCILLGFALLVVGFLMEGPHTGTAVLWNKPKHVSKKNKKRVGPLHRRAA